MLTYTFFPTKQLEANTFAVINVIIIIPVIVVVFILIYKLEQNIDIKAFCMLNKNRGSPAATIFGVFTFFTVHVLIVGRNSRSITKLILV